MSTPLTGIKVLDLTRLLPGGFATLLLGDLGADVVKVEEPGKGDYIRWTPPMVGDFSAGHVALNRNKRSIALNLKSDEGRVAFLRLAERFDVVIESFRPGVMDRLGVGWAALRARNARLIYCAITGYGQHGPRAKAAGHDANYMAYAGALSITGPEEGPPVLPGVQVGDLGAGGMGAVIAILAALHRRDATGSGDFCDVSMTDGVMSWLSIHAAEFWATGSIPQRERMPLSGAFPCYRVYPAADGWLTVAALEPQFWAELCAVLERPDLRGDAFAEGARRKEVIIKLERLFSGRTRDEWMKVFDGHDVCVAPVNDFAEALSDEHAAERGMVVGHRFADVDFLQLGNPIKLESASDATLVRRPPPQLGEHTEEVLRESLFAPEDIDELRAAGAI